MGRRLIRRICFLVRRQSVFIILQRDRRAPDKLRGAQRWLRRRQVLGLEGRRGQGVEVGVRQAGEVRGVRVQVLARVKAVPRRRVSGWEDSGWRLALWGWSSCSC
jgi:hypothetical protein